MNLRFRGLASLVFLLVLILFTAAPVTGEDGRDFAGFCKLGEPVDLGQEVRITITVRIRNCSGFDISGAIVTLENEYFPGVAYGIFPDRFTAAHGEIKQFEGEFIIPRLLYDEWERSQKPCIRVTYKNPDGNEVLRPVELSRHWIEEEN